MLAYTLTVNGQRRTIEADVDTPTLWVLREALGLTGTKFGCREGVCGACTIHRGGRAVRSCQVTIADAKGGSFTTIEGLGAGRLNRRGSTRTKSAGRPRCSRRDRPRAADYGHGASRAVLLVVGVQDKKEVERARDQRVNVISLGQWSTRAATGRPRSSGTCSGSTIAQASPLLGLLCAAFGGKAAIAAARPASTPLPSNARLRRVPTAHR
jgi:hypothetical protein